MSKAKNAALPRTPKSERERERDRERDIERQKWGIETDYVRETRQE